MHFTDPSDAYGLVVNARNGVTGVKPHNADRGATVLSHCLITAITPEAGDQAEK